MYVIFEGIDTSGKSTQVEILKNENENIIATKEPGGRTELGKTLREIILNSKDLSKRAEMFLFLADRAEHFEKVIKPNQDKLIISDRGFISGIAYALCNDESLDLEFLLNLNKYALHEAMPQKIVFFFMSEELLKSRLSSKGHDSIEQRGISYLLQVQEKMKEIIKFLNIPCLEIDAKESKENITKQIKGFLK